MAGISNLIKFLEFHISLESFGSKILSYMFLAVLVDVSDVLDDLLVSQVLERLFPGECENFPQKNSVHPDVRLWCEFTLQTKQNRELISVEMMQTNAGRSGRDNKLSLANFKHFSNIKRPPSCLCCRRSIVVRLTNFWDFIWLGVLVRQSFIESGYTLRSRHG